MSGGGGAVVWICGLPASGKSTLAARVVDALTRAGVIAVRLDGDEVRQALSPAPGYDPAARDAFYASLASLAALLARQGLAVVVAATAHRRAWRERARRQAPAFVEVYVDVPLDVCRARDPRGLYARHAAGEAPSLPGAGERFEAPDRPDVTAAGGDDGRAIEALVALVKSGRAAQLPRRQ